MIVGFPPGQATDIVARIAAKQIQDALGKPVIVENKPGAAGSIGSDLVAKADPDGYTLVVGSSGTMAINPSLYSHLPYHPLKDFEPISLLSVVPLFLVVNPSVKAETAADFVKLAKASPGKLNYGSGGSGVTSHLTMELLKYEQGMDLVHVPYKGSPAAATDLIGGQVSAMIDTGAVLLPYARNGKLRVLAVASEKRNPAAPEIPTMEEAGLGHFVAPAWVGLATPKGTPQPVIDKIYQALAKNWTTAPEVGRVLNGLGAEAVVMPPAEFRSYIQSEIDKWAIAVNLAGAKVD
ncbi:tripartite tricarboxylate transporter receptor family protein [Bordetella holmesii 41130]|nr:tripartite tricarboxylate transporter receptor family protein [Bordetella holmesii ATCC 51541]AIT24822.1 tripartite tricarboxylate transporter receptor family protein [Bordetella holmesii 44057]EWM45392.1 tripartite tricarboxylate transporter receptor family protein [Bordetella holmesii 70147]EWM48278.1 tripartite tricarboxylate transporter receptor family protein [Bordetella holmesii 41130]